MKIKHRILKIKQNKIQITLVESQYEDSGVD